MQNFEIINKIGDGAYSEVFKVRRKIDSKIYALKKVKLKNLKEKEKINSLSEIRILASIKSPFIISYKEAFFTIEDKSLNLVMEFADNGDLYQKIKYYKSKNLFFDEKDVWKIFIQITRGLKTLHDLKILHRDFKSANIFLFKEGIAKIGDLNVSKVITKGLGNTQTGTPYYASPEVWNNSTYDCKSDIWSLGCILYEMLTLNPPFTADDFDGLYKKVMSGKYNKINSRYSEDMNELLKLLFKVDPKERPNCDEILKTEIIRKRIEFFKAEAGLEFNDIDATDDNELLKTIKLSKNLLYLKDNLPKPNYSLPKITIKKNIMNQTKISNVANFKSDDSLTINNITNKTNRINTVSSKLKIFSPKVSTNINNNNLSIQKVRLNSDPKEIIARKRVKELYNLYSSQKYKIIPKIKTTEEKKNVNINIKKSNDINNNDKRIFETYKLYLSKDIRKFLLKNKRYKLPKINKFKNPIIK